MAWATSGVNRHQTDAETAGSRENSRRSISPSQKFGIETPQTAAIMSRLSAQLPFRQAARKPSGMPTPIAIRRPVVASAKALGSRSSKSANTRLRADEGAQTQ